MSISYAERRHALPLSFGSTEVTIATCEPLDIAWVRRDRGAHAQRTVKLVIVNPIEIARYTTEFYALSRSVRNATKMGETAALANFEQLVELGKTNKQLDANDSGVDPGRRLALAVRLRPARLRHPPRAAPRAQRDPLPHRRRDAHRLPAAARRDERDDRARQAARPHGRGRAAPPARRPHQGAQPGRRRGRDAAVDAARPRSARRW